MKVAFRVDASPQIGIGHLMRCLALSEELIRRGHTCSIFTKTDNNDLLKRIKTFHVDVQNIDANVSLKKDLQTLLKFSRDYEIDWIVTDHYSIDTTYINEIKKQGFHVLSIDDTSQMHYPSDIVINQNIDAERLKFSIESYTMLLRGPTYSMLRDELLVREKKKHHDSVKTILITLGGSDPDNYLLEVLQSLDTLTTKVDIQAVIGPFNQFLSQLKSYEKQSSANITLITSPEKMVDFYLESDLAVSAGGSSCYELAYFGIPNFIITIADNQLGIAQEFDRQHLSVYLGMKHQVKPEVIKDKIKVLIENHSLRKQMSQQERNLIDGNGKKRVVDCMEREE
jgi:UDP-2,4-diacetamido-2,4,6-trideoxy-beta-L-altropyranose hydrolase